ncbi:hypothetical protein E4U57_001325, partial [Claviceps arundinis]
MAFEMGNLTESGVDDVRKGKAQMQPAGESGEDPPGPANGMAPPQGMAPCFFRLTATTTGGPQ